MKAPLSKSAVFAALPPVWPGDLKPLIRQFPTEHQGHKLVILDDDPTGTQTVHDLPVLTTWDREALCAEFGQPGPCFYILTNSRSLIAEEAKALNQEIAANLCFAAGERSFTVVSRSDSTLRGHFPLETDVLTEELGPFDGTLIIPYFEAGGRYTIGDVHYVAEGDRLTPASETPFAKDAVFGYENSNLCQWVEEKTQGRVKAEDVASISLETIRTGGPAAVCAQLLGLTKGSTCIVNAAALSDMDVFALGLLQAEKAGRRYLIRAAAQIVSARLGLETRSLLNEEDVNAHQTNGGLILVGSYVPKTTEQLSHLLVHTNIDRIELPVTALLDETQRGEVITDALTKIHDAIRASRDIVVFTSRTLITGDDSASNLSIGNCVSAALVTIVKELEVCPRYLIAKGGITSSDIATKGLGIKRGIVTGQLLPGVPVWRTGGETRFPGIAYIIFPGNVGTSTALTDSVNHLSK
ncbi:MAG: hypothetical protein HC845_04140 [Akkermansiaceae bacterium]|nr:hypothetical protein [Akkermansiaceae bacterium]